jgi:hypothetical protein
MMLNKDAFYQSGHQSAFTMSRHKLQYFRIIFLTSLFWVLVDAFLIFYLTDCSSNRINQLPCDQQIEHLEQQIKSLQLKLNGLEKNNARDAPADHDYDENLRIKNERLHKIHKLKEAKKKPKNGQNQFLNKLKEWFKEDHSNEPTNPPSWPGENGRSVSIPQHLKAESDKRFKENQFNIVASDLVALNRSVPDQRSDA